MRPLNRSCADKITRNAGMLQAGLHISFVFCIGIPEIHGRECRLVTILQAMLALNRIVNISN